MLRSKENKSLFNVFAVDSKDDPLACVALDLTFEQASGIVEVLNKQTEVEDEV